MTEWKKEGPEKRFDAGTVQYLRARHQHEGAYDVVFADGDVRVLPDGDTSTRTRLNLIASALSDLAERDRIEPIAYLVGVLSLHGIRNIEVDGEPLFDADAAEFRIVVSTSGAVRVVHDRSAR